MLKNIVLIILSILLLVGLYERIFVHKEIDNTVGLKATLSKLEHDVKTLSLHDTMWTQHIKLTRDSLKKERENVEFWKRKYKAPIEATKAEIKQVFEQDYTEITKKVKKGAICDSLQNKQAIEIETLNHAMAGFDSLVLVKNAEILKLHGIDSTHLKIESTLQALVKRRTIGEIALGALDLLLLLVLILH